MDLRLRFCVAIGAVAAQLVAVGQAPAPPEAAAVVLLKPTRVFDGEAIHDGWVVRVRGDRIDAVGPAASVPLPPRASSICRARP
jgi:hypothetical protein